MAKNYEIPIYDVVVVGGGIGGMYCSLKLAQKQLRVALFEKSNRWGGRIETVRMGKGSEFKAEFGSMRYEEKGQKLLRSLLEELQLEYSPFPEYQSSKPKWPDYHIQDPEEERWQEDPLDLLRMGILKVLGLYRDGMSKTEMEDEIAKFGPQEPASAPEYDFDNLRKTARQGGHPNRELLYTRGLWNALSDELSHRAVLKIRDMGNFYHIISDNPNAIEWIIFWLRGLQPHDRLVGIKGGSAQLTNKLLKKLDEFKTLTRVNNQELIGMRSEGELVRLFFKGEIQEVLAKRAILAMPKQPLLPLGEYFPEPIQNALQAVVPIPLMKIFFVTDSPWWDEDTQPQTGAYTLPTREIHYYQEHSLQLSQSKQKQYGATLDEGIVSQSIRDEFLNAGIELPDNMTVKTKENGLGWIIYYTLYRQSHEYFIRKEDLSVFNKNGKGMVMVYTDRTFSEYWNHYILDPNHHDRAEIRGDLRLVEEFFKYLANDIEMLQEENEAFERDGLPYSSQSLQTMSVQKRTAPELKGIIEDFGIHDWGKEPYGAACHAWRPNTKSWEIIVRLRAFSLIDDRDMHENIHICGEAYSDYHGFIEGALRSVRGVLDWIELQDYRDVVPGSEEKIGGAHVPISTRVDRQIAPSIDSLQQLGSVNTRQGNIMLEALGKHNFNCLTDYALERLNSIHLDKLEVFFDNLPADPYVEGNERFRRYSCFKLSDRGLVKVSRNLYCPDTDGNPLVDNSVRDYAELNDALIEHDDFQKVVLEFFDFCKACSAPNEVGVHQIRTVVSPQNTSHSTPEGIHREGVQLVGIFCISRNRIAGGEIQLFQSKDSNPTISKILNPGELLVFNDRHFLHLTTVPNTVSSEQQGIQDVFVLTCPGLIPASSDERTVQLLRQSV